MKVLKDGKWNLPWSATMKCATCEAELLVEEADVKPVDEGSGYFCTCPICAKTIYVPDKDLPLRVREALDRVRKPRRYYSER